MASQAPRPALMDRLKRARTVTGVLKKDLGEYRPDSGAIIGQYYGILIHIIMAINQIRRPNRNILAIIIPNMGV